MARFELAASPFASSSVTILDLEQASPNYKAFKFGMDGGDGYGYLFPSYDGSPCSNGRVVRFSLSDFTTSSVSAVDTGYPCANGGFTDGSGHLYVIWGQHANVVRVSMASFTAARSTTLDLNANRDGPIFFAQSR